MLISTESTPRCKTGVSPRLRILVFGAGSVGSVLGGLLQRSGHEVTLLGRPNHMHAIRGSGLRIRGIWGTHLVMPSCVATSLDEVANQPFDLVLLTVKSYDTGTAAESIREIGGAGSLVISLQNGFGNTQILESALGTDRVLGARVITGVDLVEPGCVEVTVSADEIRIGPPDGKSDRLANAERVAAILREAGVPAQATSQYREYLWAKLLYNAALNPLGALLHARYGELASDDGCRSIMDRVFDEAFCVTAATNIPMFWNDAAQYRRHFYDVLIPATSSHYPSMYRDLQRRGRTEIDAINGAIVRLGASAAVPTATNEVLVSMVRMREQTRRAEFDGIAVR